MTMKIERQPAKASKRTQLLATLFATIGSFGLGTVLSWSAPTLPQLDLETHGVCDTDLGPGDTGLCLRLTREEQSWVASLLNFGAFTAGPISGQCLEDEASRWWWWCVRFADAEVWQEGDHDASVGANLRWLALPHPRRHCVADLSRQVWTRIRSLCPSSITI